MPALECGERSGFLFAVATAAAKLWESVPISERGSVNALRLKLGVFLSSYPPVQII
jgi:hypothetical protein